MPEAAVPMRKTAEPMKKKAAPASESALDLESLAAEVVALAMKAGASDAEAVIREGDEFSVNVRMGEVETLKESGSRGLGLRVFAANGQLRPRPGPDVGRNSPACGWARWRWPSDRRRPVYGTAGDNGIRLTEWRSASLLQRCLFAGRLRAH